MNIILAENSPAWVVVTIILTIFVALNQTTQHSREVSARFRMTSPNH